MTTATKELRNYRKYSLLGSNAKLAKAQGTEYLLQGLTLAPHSLGGPNVCKSATPACKSACVLWFTGRTVTKTVRAAMLRRKRYFFEYRDEFEAQLNDEIEAHEQSAIDQGLIPVIRLNVASDLDWAHIAEQHPRTKFYDYTKVFSRITRFANNNWPSNYELTYSLNERTLAQQINFCAVNGVNIAAVISSRYWPQGKRIDPLPMHFTLADRLLHVVDGDLNDVRLRELDGAGNIVGLRFKGSLKKRALAIKNGFCLDESNGHGKLLTSIVSDHYLAN